MLDLQCSVTWKKRRGENNDEDFTTPLSCVSAAIILVMMVLRACRKLLQLLAPKSNGSFLLFSTAYGARRLHTTALNPSLLLFHFNSSTHNDLAEGEKKRREWKWHISGIFMGNLSSSAKRWPDSCTWKTQAAPVKCLEYKAQFVRLVKDIKSKAWNMMDFNSATLSYFIDRCYHNCMEVKVKESSYIWAHFIVFCGNIGS